MPATIFVIEDHDSCENSVASLLKQYHFDVQTFSTPSSFYEVYEPSIPGCLILDWKRSLSSGIALAEELGKRSHCPPYIIVGAKPTCCDLSKAMKGGAQDFFEWPLDVEVFIKRVCDAIEVDAKRREQRAISRSVDRRIQSLSPREKEILGLVLDGKLSKQIASQLEISVKTVESHRANILKKMNVDSFIQVVCLVAGKRSPTDGPMNAANEVSYTTQ